MICFSLAQVGTPWTLNPLNPTPYRPHTLNYCCFVGMSKYGLRLGGFREGGPAFRV